MTYQLVASPYPDGHLVVIPGREGGIQIGANRFAELRDATPTAPVPDWHHGRLGLRQAADPHRRCGGSRDGRDGHRDRAPR
jgi:hypothetical protein